MVGLLGAARETEKGINSALGAIYRNPVKAVFGGGKNLLQTAFVHVAGSVTEGYVEGRDYHENGASRSLSLGVGTMASVTNLLGGKRLHPLYNDGKDISGNPVHFSDQVQEAALWARDVAGAVMVVQQAANLLRRPTIKAPPKRGGESATARTGRQAHEAFKKKVKAKSGW